MSSKTKTSRKAKNPRPKAPEPIITRTKSRQLRNKEDKKTEKPELPKPEIKPTKVNKTVKRPQVSLIKLPDKESESDVDKEQVEYYPNTLKRDVTTKKIMLTPKHNFKVIAATNKRKLATPQKGIKSPPSKHSSPQNGSKSLKGSKISTKPCSSPELSMQDMVRMMEETRSLSDEDFMEILTCPSPVWWEDPPDGGFVEDSIHTKSPEPPPAKIIKETKKRKVTENKKSSKSNDKNIITIEHDAEQPKEIENKNDEGFVQKKQKLEHILGNIKNKTIRPKHEVKNDNETNRKLSESEGDFSDLSFNEEEILKNLENMEIPIEQSLTEPSDSLDNKSEIDDIEIKEEAIYIHENEIVEPKNDNVDREILTIEIKSEIKEEFSLKSPVFHKDSIANTSSEFKSDVSLEEINSNLDKKSDDIVIVDNCTNSSLGNNDDSSSLIDLDNSFNSYMKKNEISKIKSSNVYKDANISNTVNNNEIVPNKKTKDLSEFITVYKITPEKFKIENNPDNEINPGENTKITKFDTVRGKLNDFFKQCKSTIRLKNTEKPSPAIPVTDVKERTENEKENGDTKIDLVDDKNRLKNCDYCIEKIENGTTDFSCEKCEMAPILPCGLCNFLADTKEIYKKHVSSCKDVARISWSHNYVLNQT